MYGNLANINNKLYFLSAYIRARIYSLFLKKTGKKIFIQHDVIFRNLKYIELGNNVYINHHAEILAGINGIKIGNDVMIGQYAKLLTTNHSYTDLSIPMNKQTEISEHIIIHDDVWIGANAIILPGIEIGKGAVVGASALVTKDVPEFAIVGGVPAKIIKYRNKKKK